MNKLLLHHTVPNKYTKSMQEKRYTRIPAKPPIKDILTRLGVRKSSENPILEQQARHALSGVDTSGICMRAQAEVYAGGVSIGGREFCSEKLAEYMQGCGDALLLAATAGQNTADKIEELMHGGAADEAVVLDAAAAVAVDYALDFMVGAWARENARLGLRPLKRRYSPGYGDLPLSCQADIFRLVRAEELGISVTESFMLQPDKSVFAICGVERCV